MGGVRFSSAGPATGDAMAKPAKARARIAVNFIATNTRWLSWLVGWLVAVELGRDVQLLMMMLRGLEVAWYL